MKKILIIFLSLIVLAAIVFSFTKTCDLIESGENRMNRAKPQQCDCNGMKITVENKLEVDGNYRTVCIGINTPKS